MGLTVREYIAVALTSLSLGISVSENVGVSDSQVIREQQYNVSKYESVAVAETPAVRFGNLIVSVSDGVTISEAPSNVNETPLILSVNERINVSESGVSASIGSAGGPLSISGFESVAVSESPASILGGYNVSVSETIFTSDSFNNINLSPLKISTFELVTASDGGISAAVQAAGTLNISNSENISVSDIPSAQEPNLYLTASDAVSISDAIANIGITPLAINVLDRVITSDSSIVQIGSAGDLFISKSEVVSISDSESVRLASFNITTQENLSVSDSSTNIGLDPILISVIDQVIVTDLPSTPGFFPGSGLVIDVYENLSIAESSAIGDGSSKIFYIRKAPTFIVKTSFVSFRIFKKPTFSEEG
jgi:hypothetical protein